MYAKNCNAMVLNSKRDFKREYIYIYKIRNEKRENRISGIFVTFDQNYKVSSNFFLHFWIRREYLINLTDTFNVSDFYILISTSIFIRGFFSNEAVKRNIHIYRNISFRIFFAIKDKIEYLAKNYYTLGTLGLKRNIKIHLSTL